MRALLLVGDQASVQFFVHISKKKPKKKEAVPLTVKMTPVTEAQALKEK